MTSPLYTTSVTAFGEGRDGRVQSIDGLLDTKVSTPKELGGQGGATNPEQLFAAGYAACFHSALKMVARKTKADTTDSEVVADISLIMLPSGGLGLAAQLEITLPALDHETAQSLVEQAHQVCPYSNATRGNIEVKLVIA